MRERTGWRDLALFGGDPLFTASPLHVNKPNLPNRERLFELIDGMLARRWFSDGQLVRQFEEEICSRTGARHCIATCNGTIALEIAFRALNLTGEVIVPSFTFAATVQALRWLGITAIFCDVDPVTHTIDPRDVETLINSRTTAVVGVHLWGEPCDIEALTAITRRHRLPLVFDAAHALGCTYRGQLIGGFGSAEVFSFHATKFVNTAEGGAITTNDDALARRCRMARDFGFDVDDRIVELGTNGKMSEISAALGLTHMGSFDELISANERVYRHYESGLSGIAGISMLPAESCEKRNYQYIVTMIDEQLSGISRDSLLEILQAEKIFAKPYFQPGCHRMFPSAAGEIARDLAVTDKLARTVLVLPGGASIDRSEVEGVCQTIQLAVRNAAEIGRAR